MVYIVFDSDGGIQAVYEKEHEAKARANGIGGTCESFCLN